MFENKFGHVFLVAVAASTTVFGQGEIQLHPRHMSGWDARSREGRCEIHVWVDNRAEVRLRGDGIFVRTLEGSKSRDEGSQCSQPLPYNSLRDFQIRQTAGRSQVTLAQQPDRMNNYTATIAITDQQGGGDNYAFEVTWLSEGDAATAPAPFFDDVRACQDSVRQRFLSQNGRGSYVDFDNFADRQGQSQNPGRGQGYGQGYGQNKGGNRAQETIQGRGSAKSWSESRELTYACAVDTQRGQILSSDYHYSAEGVRTNQRSTLR